LREQGILVQANPDRVGAGREVMQNHPEVNVFLLDDGFQHRRLARDIDIVLIDATNPLGHGHVHPRGLLRESISGLARAAAIILTRCEHRSAAELDEIERSLRRYALTIPILRCRFAHKGLRSAGTSIAAPPDNSPEMIRSKKVFATAAIANPGPFESSLRNMSKSYVGQHWFPDHHDYTSENLIDIRRQAINAGADVIVTTEKDWVKMRQIRSALDGSPPIWRLDLDVVFDADAEKTLSDLIAAGLRGNRPMHNGSAQRHQAGKG
jgi:tetraacyldisaccharide 4'-kinase